MNSNSDEYTCCEATFGFSSFLGLHLCHVLSLLSTEKTHTLHFVLEKTSVYSLNRAYTQLTTLNKVQLQCSSTLIKIKNKLHKTKMTKSEIE